MDSHGPVGVFDSGVGGLSVLKAIRAALPAEDLIYVADTAHVPYGEKSPEFISERSLAVARFLAGRNVKSIVVACNTATGMAVSKLRERYSFPIVGIEPALKPAALQTRAKVVGVLATRATLESEKFARLAASIDPAVRILAQSCPGLVEQVEAGEFAGGETRSLLEKYLRPLLSSGADSLVLGCTHYPFLSRLINEIAGPGVSLHDPSEAVARELGRRLRDAELLDTRGRRGEERFFVSGSLLDAKKSISRLWGKAQVLEM